VRYADDAGRLAHAAAELLAAGPAPGGFLPHRERQTALAARDAVTQELRDLTRGLLGAVAEDATTCTELLLTSPTHALHAALSDMPPTARDHLPLSDLFRTDARPLTRAWQDAARAAVTLERYHDLLPMLSGQDAWAIARDAAEVAAALPHLDADLAAALPPSSHSARAALLHPDAHGLVRLAAAELLAQTADLTPGSALAEVTVRPRIHSVRTLTDLPDATATLAVLLEQRGAEVTVAETRSTAQALAQGIDLTIRLWVATNRVDGPPSAVLQCMRDAIPALRQLLHEPFATLTPPAPAVVHLAHQVREGLEAAGSHVDRLERSVRHGAATQNLVRLTAPMTQWALVAPRVATELHHSLQQAAATGRLLEPRRGQGPEREQHLLWHRPMQGTYVNPCPAVRAAATAATALNDARAAFASNGLNLQSTPSPDAALQATFTFDDLRTALHARPQRELPNPARPQHPALPPVAGHRRSPRPR
jgi:hypothetical protein